MTRGTNVTSKNIQVEFFAAYRDATGTGTLQVNTAAASADELFSELQQQFPALEAFAARKLAINDELKPWSSPISDGDRILFFPPVAGG